MNLVAALKSGLDVHKDQAFQLNYAIANDPELSGEEFHACQRYVDACRALGMAVEEILRDRRRPFGPLFPGRLRLFLKLPCLPNTMPCPASATAAVIRPTGL